MSLGGFPDCLSQRILVGIILVGRLGVGPTPLPGIPPPFGERETAPTLHALVRPISLLRLSQLRFVDSTFREIPYGPGNFTPLAKDSAWVKPSEIHNLSTETSRSMKPWQGTLPVKQIVHV